jgi:acyl carrier protein
VTISDQIIALLGESLGLRDVQRRLTRTSPLLGHLPELDSMAVLAVIQAIERRFRITIEDDEISADTFESVASLSAFVEAKQASSRPDRAQSA